MWNEIKYQGIVKIEKLVSEYNIWELHKIPYGKFKIKIYESSNHTYSGYTNLHIADGLGDYCCAVGHGKTEKQLWKIPFQSSSKCWKERKYGRSRISNMLILMTFDKILFKVRNRVIRRWFGMLLPHTQYYTLCRKRS